MLSTISWELCCGWLEAVTAVRAPPPPFAVHVLRDANTADWGCWLWSITENMRDRCKMEERFTLPELVDTVLMSRRDLSKRQRRVMIIPIYCCWIDGKYQSHYICVAREDLLAAHMQHPLYIYTHFCKHLLPQCVRISVKQMDKQLPGICFCRLATCAKMGIICSMCHRSVCCSTTRRVAIVEHHRVHSDPFCLKANARGK